METASISEFRNNLKDYLSDVEFKGEHILLLRGGRAIAEIIPVNQSAMKNKRKIPKRIKLKVSATESLLKERLEHDR